MGSASGKDPENYGKSMRFWFGHDLNMVNFRNARFLEAGSQRLGSYVRYLGAYLQLVCTVERDIQPAVNRPAALENPPL